MVGDGKGEGDVVDAVASGREGRRQPGVVPALLVSVEVRDDRTRALGEPVEGVEGEPPDPVPVLVRTVEDEYGRCARTKIAPAYECHRARSSRRV
ncbi:hypothetical protein [Nonomuraea lactucae]|uniref:hypothetical protein n=1 Tax=Nonomuraea lactucae TaxID=2249762 RepID=UPI0013B388A0|nr:hypothetical protein [Nonomuraea lactucae]